MYRVLLKYDMVDQSINKKKQTKYVKYERKHSNALWHIDWSKYNDREKLIIIEDDASRFIAGLEVYSEETIDNTIELYGKPLEVLTDHGTQYFSTWEEIVYYYNYKRKHMSLSIDSRLVVTPAMAYEEKGGKLNVKEQ